MFLGLCGSAAGRSLGHVRIMWSSRVSIERRLFRSIMWADWCSGLLSGRPVQNAVLTLRIMRFLCTQTGRLKFEKVGQFGDLAKCSALFGHWTMEILPVIRHGFKREKFRSHCFRVIFRWHNFKAGLQSVLIRKNQAVLTNRYKMCLIDTAYKWDHQKDDLFLFK